ncbi:hypothetical protein AMATHDRAFT_76246 [Amanita thiersii Skay4041]|uniref:PIN domain-like protein n=1 Tax=Amanita thiersii Skay4041 TaxID=703135 RepID=A0A2A9NJ63_9AGAR|nr:hypothetical protein AMATHDRAFT_76246 [Amanita thiersii Skay4041]
MGVLGLTPFLQKTCPEVIKHLPDRLKGLAGKKIAIDGTLITQRLHFAPVPHQYRHILGWYRLAKDLQEAGVTAVCVFDGKERNHAKAREAIRRQEARQLVAARSTVEMKRLGRLQKLRSIWHRWRSLSREDCNRVSELLKTLDVPQSPQVTSTTSAPRLQDHPFPVLPPTPPPGQESPHLSPNDIPASIADLYMEYHNSVSQLASLSPKGSAIATLPPISQFGIDPDARAEVLMSKAQYQLTLEEGKLWTKIFTPQVQLDQKMDWNVDGLTQKSSIMSESYRRRTDAPRSKTYEESKEIIQAMGIPCIETTGAFEAEALASSMVRHGLADYVVSEDTDVLVYEVPLLRNFTNRGDPLMMMCGAHVRSMLQLGRDAYIDFALLLGTDFSERIKNVGPARAFKFIKEHGSIERVLANEIRYPPRLPTNVYLAQVEIARMVFRTLPPVPNQDQLVPAGKNDDHVVHLLQRSGLGREVILNEEWDYQSALGGNYFADDPRAY